MKRARARAPAKVQRAERMKGEREGSEGEGSVVVEEFVEEEDEEVSSRGKRTRRSGDEEEEEGSEGLRSGGRVLARGCWRRKTAVTPRMRVEP